MDLKKKEKKARANFINKKINKNNEKKYELKRERECNI